MQVAAAGRRLDSFVDQSFIHALSAVMVNSASALWLLPFALTLIHLYAEKQEVQFQSP